MIPPLPAELLIKILDLGTSPSYAMSSHRDDRHLLRQCCLVSKQLCAIAQPKLWSVLTGEKGIRLAESARQTQHVRVLEYPGLSGRRITLLNALKTFPKVIELRVSRAEFAPMELASFALLKHLTLRSVDIDVFPSVVFPNLVSLTLDSIETSIEAGQTLVAASFPSLRALQSRWCEHRDTGQQLFLEPINLPFGQPDILQVEAYDRGVLPSDLGKRGAAVVLSVGARDVEWMTTIAELASFDHLLIQDIVLSNSMTSTYLSSLVALLETRENTLSLSLPITLSRSSPLSPSIAAVRDRLLLTCAFRNIDIVWHPYYRAWEDGLGVSNEFWAYAKDLKRKKQLEAEGSG